MDSEERPLEHLSTAELMEEIFHRYDAVVFIASFHAIEATEEQCSEQSIKLAVQGPKVETLGLASLAQIRLAAEITLPEVTPEDEDDDS